MIDPFRPYPGYREEPPQRAELPYLTLYIPSIGQEITLSRDRITVGNSKFRDLDLSQLPNARFMKPHQATFAFEKGRWFLTSLYEGGQVCINDRNIGGMKHPLHDGDFITFGGREVLIVRDAGFKPAPGAQKLTSSIQLFFESIHLVNGHVGSSVTYEADRRMIVSKQWGITGGKEVDSTPKETPVPDSVVTVDDLYRYAQQELHLRVHPRNNPCGEDILMWLSQDCVTQYVAERGEVLYRKTTFDPDGNPVAKDSWLRMTGSRETEEDIRRYARRFWPHIPQNRKNDLDEDINLSTTTDGKLNYLAENRLVIRSVRPRFGAEPIPEESLPIPAHITEYNELLWYIDFHRSSWSKSRLHSDEMFRDMVLSSGKKRIQGRRLQYETRYIAESRTVVHQMWESGIGAGAYSAQDSLAIPYITFDKKSLLKYVWEKKPDWK